MVALDTGLVYMNYCGKVCEEVLKDRRSPIMVALDTGMVYMNY